MTQTVQPGVQIRVFVKDRQLAISGLFMGFVPNTPFISVQTSTLTETINMFIPIDTVILIEFPSKLTVNS